MADLMREALGEVRYRLSNGLKDRYPDMYGAKGFMQTTEAYLIKTWSGLDLQGRTANYYIVPGDGGGPIVVEIDAENDSKWEDLLSTDGKPVRVLQVDLGGRAQLVHGRDTQFEADLLNVLEQH